MRILIVSRYKDKYPSRQAPFVTEQGEAIAKSLREVKSEELKVKSEPSEVEFYLLKGNYLKQYFALWKKVKEWKPDIIHAHYGITAIVAELQCQVPVVTTFHNGETHTKHVNFVSSLCSKLAKHVIYVAPHIRQKLYFKAKNYSIIPCGISLEDCFLMNKVAARKELGWDADKKYILFGGAFFDLRKNYPLLREAVEQVKSEEVRDKSGKENKPQMNDSSEVSNTLPEYIKSQNDNWITINGGEQLGDVVCMEMWKRTRRECMLMMNAADVFALPTKNEGSPQALKEAMACNCPIVATDVSDIKYMLGDLPGHYVLANKRGTQADWKGDEHSVDELAELLGKALSFKGRTQGRERIREIGYTNEQIARKIIKIYETILS